jgi:peptide/nickel transport system permease protein
MGRVGAEHQAERVVAGRGWAWFIGRRLVALAVLLVVISFVVFSLQYLAPGSVIDTLLGTNPRTPQEVQYLTNEYHLNKSFWDQYWIWASQAVRLNFGNSIQTSLPVTTEISERLPTSLFLGVYAYILTMVLGVGGGLLAALRRQRLADRGIVGASMVALSTPAFVSGVVGPRTAGDHRGVRDAGRRVLAGRRAAADPDGPVRHPGGARGDA